MRSMLSGMTVVAAALALASSARAEGWPPPDPVLIPNRPVLMPAPSHFPWAYRVLHPGEEYHYYSGYAHHLSDYNCGNFASETRFIWGSCKVWWNEPFTYHKPPILLPDGSILPEPYYAPRRGGPGGPGGPGVSSYGPGGAAGCIGCGNW